MATSGPPPSAAASLAPELLHIIFAPLPQPTILTAAAVCSWWRACAIQHPMYYRSWAFVFPTQILSTLGYSQERADMRQLESIVSESEENGYSVGLSIFVHLEQLPPSDGVSTDDIDIAAPLADDMSSFEAAGEMLESALVPILQRALARCMVLNASCDVSSFDVICNGLSRPAPFLRRLKISIENSDPLYSLVEREPLPAGFLSADAPRLTEVSLFSTAVSASSPCFPSVRTLLLYCPLSLAAAHTAFPGTKHLTIQRLADDYEVSGADRTIFDGVEALYIGPKDVDILVDVPVLHHNTHIPLIEYTGDHLNEFSDLMPVSGDISVYIFENVRHDWDDLPLDVPPRFGQVCIEFRAGGRIRRVDSDVSFADSCGFLGIGPALGYITNLTIDDRHLRTFMGTWECLPALRILRITLITWARAAPGVPLTPAEEIIYGSDHVRSQCACLGGLFSDHYGGSCPDGDVHMELMSLQTLELCATRPYAVVPMPILSALSRSFGRRIHLVLSNGLALSEDAARPLFASITSSDASFFPTLPCVARAAALMEAAASERKDALQDMDHALRKYGAGFHWDHCHEASPISREDPRLAVT